MARLLRPRHIAATLCVFVLLGGGGATLLGVVQATDQADPAKAFAPAEPIGIPLPNQGDRGEYSREMRPAPEFSDRYGGFAFGGSNEPLRFEWGESRRMPNRTGVEHWVNVLHTSQKDGRVTAGPDGEPMPDWANDTFYVYAGRPAVLAKVYADQRTDAPQSTAILPGVPTGTQQTNTSMWMTSYWDGPLLDFPGGACGIVNGLQGHEIPLDGEPIQADAGCPFLRFDGPEVRLHVDGVGGEVGEREVRLRVQSSSFDLPYGWLLFREGNPYPLRVELPVTFGGDPWLVTWTLTGLDRGAQPIPGDAQPKPLPALELRKRPLWTVDDEGVEHPFPLSAAFARAQEDPEFPELREFLAAHPDAYTAWARYVPFTNGPFVRQSWDFGVTDGSEHLGVRSFRETGPLYLAGFGIPGTQREIYQADTVDDPQFGHTAGWLKPDEMPAEVPSAASLLARWKAYASPAEAEGPADAWEFYFARDPDGEGGEPGLWMAAGHSQANQTWGPTYPILDDSTVTWSGSMLGSYDGWDHVDRLDEGSQSSRRTVAGAPAPVQGPASASPSPLSPASAPIKHLSALVPLTPAQAAGIGAGALLASLLYWLWPALKSGPLLLFSRVREDEVLRNPLRARLMARIEAEPGVHQQELVRTTGQGNGTVEHHLDRLVAAGLVVRHRSAGFTCYFARGAADRRAVAAAPVLKSKVARAILEAARVRPGITARELAAELHVSAPTIHYHVDRLRNAGVLHGDRRGHAVHLSAPAAVSG